MLSDALPLLLAGAGNMGGALIAGWRRAGVIPPQDLIVVDPSPGEAARTAASEGARLNPPDETLRQARTVVIAVKPQIWRSVAETLAPKLAGDAVILSIMAGVRGADLAELFSPRPVVRVMPTTAAAVLKGAASVWSPDAPARRRAEILFSPLGAVVQLPDEGLMHVATAASGSAPAYAFALVEALEAAAAANGLAHGAARALARSALIGAAALLESSGAEAAELRRQVTSPGGTTEAALKILMGEGGLADLMTRAVAAGAARSRELGA